MRNCMIVLGFLLATVTSAQTLEYQYPLNMLRAEGNQITFCVAEDAPFSALEEDVARLIARTLGVNAQFYPYDRYRPQGRVTGIKRREFVILLTDHCDVFMGMPRSINSTFDYPADEEQLSTRPYMTAKFVFVSRNTEFESLRTLPEGTSVLFEHASLPNMFISRVRPDLKRVHAVAMVGSHAQFDRFDRGDTDVMIAWAPAFFERYGSVEAAQEQGLIVLEVNDLPNMDWLIVGGVSKLRSSLRSQIDAAILHNIQNGRLQELLDDYEMPKDFFGVGPVEFAAVEGDDEFEDDDDEFLEGIDFREYGYDVVIPPSGELPCGDDDDEGEEGEEDKEACEDDDDNDDDDELSPSDDDDDAADNDDV